MEVFQTDHDIMIELRTEMKEVRKDIKDLKDGTKEDIISLKADVRWLQRVAYTGLGILAGAQFYFNFLKK